MEFLFQSSSIADEAITGAADAQLPNERCAYYVCALLQYPFTVQ